MANVRTFILNLDHPEQLFEADPVSPMSPKYNEYTAQPAMDTIRDQLLMRTPAQDSDVVVEVVLPGDQVRPGLDEELTTAVRRWVKVQNMLDTEATQVSGSVGRRLLIFGILIFLALQITSYIVKDQAVDGDQYILDAIGEGLSVASWVMLWFPVQLVSVEVWRARIRRRRMGSVERLRVIVSRRA